MPIVNRNKWLGNPLLYVFVSHLILSTTLKCTTNVLSSICTVKIVYLHIAYINKMANFIKSFKSSEDFCIRNQKVLWSICSTMTWWLKHRLKNILCTPNLEKLQQKDLSTATISPYILWKPLISKKYWIEHLSFRNEVIGGHIGRSNSMHWDYTRDCFFLWWLLECYECSAPDWIMVQLLLAKNQTNIISLVAIFVGQTQAGANRLQHLNPETTECSTSLYFEISDGNVQQLSNNPSLIISLLSQFDIIL